MCLLPSRLAMRPLFPSISRLATCVLAAALAGGAAAQDSFTHEIRLTLDRAKLKVGTAAKVDTKALEEALKKRLPILRAKNGTVEVKNLEDIRIRVPVDRVDPSQLKMLVVPGQLELRHLEDVQTNLNPHGKYVLDVLSRSDGQDKIRFRERDGVKVIQPEEFFRRCPLIVSNEDLEPGDATVVREGALMAVRVGFNKRATERMNRFQSKPGRILVILLDGEIITLNSVTRKAEKPRKKGDEPKDDGRTTIDIGGGFAGEDEAAYLAAVFNAGPLPVPLKVVSAQIVSE